MRSIAPLNVNFIALTATATTDTRRDIMKMLGIEKPVIVSKSPNKNYVYQSYQKRTGGTASTFFNVIWTV